MKPLQTFTLLTHKLPRYQSSINHSLARDCCTVDQWFAICLKYYPQNFLCYMYLVHNMLDYTFVKLLMGL